MIQQSTFWDASGQIHVDAGPVDTRAAALASIQCSRKSDLRTVLEFFRERGEHGAIDAEVEALGVSVGKRESTFRARRVELFQAGVLVNSGRTRKTKSARQAIVWRINE